MKLDSEFIKLPLQFDAVRMMEEMAQFTATDWRPHPQGFPGNWALPLISAGGDPDNDSVKGPMRPTPFLDHCPYIRQVLGSFQSVLGRTRLMRLDNQAETTAHVDTNYYWLQRVRIHVPIVTFPEVQFHCGERRVHMAAGESWLFDTWRMHNVVNPTDKIRTHLVCDTVGSAEFWDLVKGSERPFGTPPALPLPVRTIAWQPGLPVALQTERSNFPVVMSPWEQQQFFTWLFGELEQSAPAASVVPLKKHVQNFLDRWRDLWAAYADRPEGWPHYTALLESLKPQLAVAETLPMPNSISAQEVLLQALVRSALNPELQERPTDSSAATAPTPAVRPRAARRAAAPATIVSSPTQTAMTASSPTPAPASDEPRIERPVIIVSAPRSGSSLLFETLAGSQDFRTIGGESHRVIEGFPRLRPAARGWESNRLVAADASERIRQLLPRAFMEQMRDARGVPPRGLVRLLEKTPKNALRIPFFKAVFPDARFIYLYREPRGAISSAIDAWRSGRFATYPELPGWKTLKWSLLLIPGWRDLDGQPLEQIAVRQWLAANETILDDLALMPREDWCAVDYDAFLRDTRGELERLCAFAGVRTPAPAGGALPLSRHTLTPPDPDKWKKNAAELERVLPLTAAVAARARQVLPPPSQGQLPAVTPALAPVASVPVIVADTPGPAPAVAPKDPAASPLKSVYTTNLLELFQRTGFSLLVTTYQAGKLIVLRARDGALNTHFRLMPKPMGLDVWRNKLAIGTRSTLQILRNVPALAPKVEPAGSHDACFVPSTAHVTGDIDIHEMVYDQDGQLWIVNTRFCCLCTLDADHSFVPRWKPPFITALAPEDRCHLNGIGLRDGKPRYVTMLAETDTPGGWREHKADGGTIMDITTNAVIVRGLSMPHSPRWYRDRLWVLESGKGSLGWVNTATGKVETVATLPGFTRGLDFIGPYAFVGLSQVRETAAFSGIPITEKMNERNCGVWVVNIETGKSVGFVRFEGAVQEIFAVKLLPGVRCPEVLEPSDKLAESCYILPDEALAQVPRERRVAQA